MPSYLDIDPEAQLLHEAGLRAESVNQMERAHHLFGEAITIVSDPSGPLHTNVQLAHILRNDGFTYVREALASHDVFPLGQARAQLTRSLETTAPLVSGIGVTNISARHPHETPKKARREIQAEHGATLGLLGRLATVKAAMEGLDTRGNSETAQKYRMEDQQPYGLAHDFLVKGNNGYYRVSNAMNGARQERLNGRPLHVVPWLGRAGAGFLWTATHDPKNFMHMSATFFGRLPHIKSYEAALKSVTTKP